MASTLAAEAHSGLALLKPFCSNTPPFVSTMPSEPDNSSPALPASGRKIVSPPIEKHYRSLVKAISWRATGTVDTIVISFLVTGQIKLAVSIGFVELFTKVALFYVHERIWNRIPLGRVQGPEDYTI
jgi:uncharacterized membrane protein